MPEPQRVHNSSRAERWRLAATWFNEEVDNLLAEGGKPGGRMDLATQSLLVHNILATHLREFTLDHPGQLEELCKVCISAGISEPLIGATIEAFFREYGPRPEEVRKN
jgi:hypothetical protein